MFLSIKDLKKSFGEDEYKTEVLKVLEETMNSEEKTEVKDTARSVKALITYSM